MASAKFKTTERNGKVAIWILFSEGTRKDNRLWNVWDLPQYPTMEEVMKAISSAYELGWKHKMASMNSCINQSVNMEIDMRSHE